jgi:hypothetical protein
VSKLVEHEECSHDQAGEGYGVVPVELLSEVEDAEDAEDAERDDFLHDLELVGCECFRADAVGRHLQAVFKERDRPADEDDFPKRDVFVLEMAVPRERHEDVGTNEQDDCPHGCRMRLNGTRCRSTWLQLYCARSA